MKNKIITIVLCIVMFAVPVLIIPNNETYYNLARYILLLICGAILFCAFIKNSKKLEFDKTDICIMIFIILALISAICSINIKKSILGERNRFEGVFTLITYSMLYYHAKYYLKPNNKFINVGLVTYSCILILAVIQFYMPTKVIYMLPIFGKGAHGTMGNTNFMGSFVSMLVPATALGYLFTGKKKYLLVSILSFFVMLLCIARSGWVAFVVTFIIIIAYMIKNRSKENFKRFAFIIIGFMLCLAIVKIEPKSNEIVARKGKRVVSEAKEANTTGISDRMGSGRILIWKSTYNVIKKYPIVGCGVDALADGLMKADLPGLIKFINIYHTSIDKAHNEYLQIAATIGLPALGVYLIFLTLVLDKNLKGLLKDKKSTFFFIVILGYLAQAFFNISTLGVAPIFWIVLGLSQQKE